jgi:hypothetical protein
VTDPIGDALKTDAEAARQEIRDIGFSCPSCGKNMGDLYLKGHRYDDLGEGGVPNCFNDLDAGVLQDAGAVVTAEDDLVPYDLTPEHPVAYVREPPGGFRNLIPRRRPEPAQPPSGLQLDLLTAIVRLEQIGEELAKGTAAGQDMAEYLLEERVIKCDVPRLRSYLTAETLAWEQETEG